MSARSTIAAIASAPGPALRGILRLSGPEALVVAARCCREGATLLDVPRGVYPVHFEDGSQAIAASLLVMRAPRSFTGEECVELHLPGAPALLDVALARVLAAGAEPAQPGEYTRRAFEHGRLDLVRAEGVLALATARNAADARAALDLLAGGLSRELDGTREALLDARALCEAALDFAEEDTAAVPRAEVEACVLRALAAATRARAMVHARPRTEGVPRVVLVGAPNAGKSSLYNALLGQHRALVSPQAGTTRDPLSSTLDMAGLVVELTDTAGLGVVDLPQEPADQAGTLLRVALEQAAQDRARERVAVADVGLWVADATLPLGRAPELPEGAARLLVWNQTDRPEAAAAPCLPGLPTVAVSALTGDGVDRLRQVLRELLVAQVEGAGIGRETAARQALALDGLLVELSAALEALEGGLELAAEHLARAQSALGSLGGESTPEDVLDRIFSRFCLGK